jgi:hypothetical protein
MESLEKPLAGEYIAFDSKDATHALIRVRDIV